MLEVAVVSKTSAVLFVVIGPVLFGLFAQNEPNPAAAQNMSALALILSIVTVAGGVAGVFIKAKFDVRLACLEQASAACITDRNKLQAELDATKRELTETEVKLGRAERKIEKLERRLDRRQQADPNYRGEEKRQPGTDQMPKL